MIPLVSPEKGPNKTGDELLHVGNAVMPDGGVLHMNNHSAELKSSPDLMGSPSQGYVPWSINSK